MPADKQAPQALLDALAVDGLIDCDLHNELPSLQTLYPYLADHWRDYCEESAFTGPDANDYPKGAAITARPGSRPANGQPPGSDLDLLRAQVLDPWRVRAGILNCSYRVQGVHHPDLAAALATAINQWQIDAWLDREPRLRAGIVVPSQIPTLAAAEIDRLGDHPGFVQVLLVARTQEPLGRRKYWKMYEAAARHGLPIGIHFGGTGGGPITGAGWPSYYIEDHGGMPQAFQAQVISLVYEGVFTAFPDLKFVLIEGGFAWLPPLMWRMDRLWQRMGEEIPDVQEPPSAIVRRHFWLTTQPMEEPPQRRFFRQLLDQMDMDDHLMFATDYPHWDFDAPDRAFPVELDAGRKHKFMAGNARLLYGLEPRPSS